MQVFLWRESEGMLEFARVALMREVELGVAHLGSDRRVHVTLHLEPLVLDAASTFMGLPSRSMR